MFHFNNFLHLYNLLLNPFTEFPIQLLCFYLQNFCLVLLKSTTGFKKIPRSPVWLSLTIISTLFLNFALNILISRISVSVFSLSVVCAGFYFILFCFLMSLVFSDCFQTFSLETEKYLKPGQFYLLLVKIFILFCQFSVAIDKPST